jgi:hypothetical protein
MLCVEKKADDLRAPGAQAACGAIGDIAQSLRGRGDGGPRAGGDSRIVGQRPGNGRDGKPRCLRHGAQGGSVALPVQGGDGGIVGHHRLSHVLSGTVHIERNFNRFNKKAEQLKNAATQKNAAIAVFSRQFQVLAPTIFC